MLKENIKSKIENNSMKWLTNIFHLIKKIEVISKFQIT